MSYAKLADLLLRWGMYFDQKAGRAPLFIHHQRTCARCLKPIKRNEHWRMLEGGKTAHRSCQYPTGNYPLPKTLGAFTEDGPDAA